MSRETEALLSSPDGTSSILVVHTAWKPGGATRVAIEDAIGLRQQGWRVGCAGEPGDWTFELEEAGVCLHHLYLINAARYPAWLRLCIGLPLDTLLLLYLVLRWRYRYLYLHHRQLGIACSLVARLTGVRYVFMAHVEFHGGRAATRLGRNILAVSKKVKEHLTARFGVAPADIHVLSNAVKIRTPLLDVESEAALRQEWSVKPGAPIVACVALMTEQKAHHILLDAWVDVADRFPDAVLLLAGDGSLRPALEAQAVRLGIADKVRFLGLVRDISQVYALAHFVVLSSAWEGMPLTLLEAGACGLPAVATRVSGIPEVVRHEETGLLVEPNQPVFLGQAMIRLLENSSLCRQLGNAAAELSASQFAPEPRLCKLIQYLLAASA